MASAVRYRGPDDEGVWCDAIAGVGLAHRRLSIIDVSAAGHQPMVSASGRFVIVFNGEIYNHLTLRAELEREEVAPRWCSRSDTETLLAGFDTWGILRTVSRAVGMFAIAVWDRETRTLSLVRDRLGEKPLYYGRQEGLFLFGSELKALRAHPAFRAEIDRDAVALLMRHNCIPAPFSIYRGIQKQLPGTIVTIAPGEETDRVVTYWDARQLVADGLARPFPGSPEEAVDELERKLGAAVQGQMLADVPLGAFLSGGVDSSLIVAMMQRESSRPVKTFTIGFEEAQYDESVHASAVARHLGTDHTELYVRPSQARDVIPLLPSMYCEPFADSSQIPTFLVSQLAREHVTVALSGDAGDELFAGYNRYALAQQLWQRLSLLPVGVRVALTGAITAIPARWWGRALAPLNALLPSGLAQAALGEKVIKGAGVMGADSTAELYRRLVSHWSQPEALVIGATEPLTVLTDPARRPRADSFIHEMMALDLVTYLPDDILVKVDRASMACSLETRVPLLDHRLVEFAWALPLDYKLRAGVTKWPLRQLLYRHVPRTLIERPKMGFGVPIGDWLRGPLREWAEALLSETRIQREGYFHAAPIRRKWSEHLSGRRNWQYLLWDVLMFQSWLDQWA